MSNITNLISNINSASRSVILSELARLDKNLFKEPAIPVFATTTAKAAAIEKAAKTRKLTTRMKNYGYSPYPESLPKILYGRFKPPGSFSSVHYLVKKAFKTTDKAHFKPVHMMILTYIILKKIQYAKPLELLTIGKNLKQADDICIQTAVKDGMDKAFALYNSWSTEFDEKELTRKQKELYKKIISWGSDISSTLDQISEIAAEYADSPAGLYLTPLANLANLFTIGLINTNKEWFNFDTLGRVASFKRDDNARRMLTQCGLSSNEELVAHLNDLYAPIEGNAEPIIPLTNFLDTEEGSFARRRKNRRSTRRNRK